VLGRKAWGVLWRCNFSGSIREGLSGDGGWVVLARVRVGDVQGRGRASDEAESSSGLQSVGF
jgi:hypothetical protein